MAVVQNFYDALARGDYRTAWELGGKNIGRSDYNGWVAGYATTAGVYGTASNLVGGVVQVSFSAVQTDGSVKTFADGGIATTFDYPDAGKGGRGSRPSCSAGKPAM